MMVNMPILGKFSISKSSASFLIFLRGMKVENWLEMCFKKVFALGNYFFLINHGEIPFWRNF